LEEIMLLFLVSLQLKHLLADFYAQTPYMYKNKGHLDRFGGWLHGLVHFFYLLIMIWMMFPPQAFRENLNIILFVCFIDLISHVLIDYLKVSICEKMEWEPLTSEKYWYALGVDQFLHQMFYIGYAWTLSFIISN
jgi:hypothetical protein